MDYGVGEPNDLRSHAEISDNEDPKDVMSRVIEAGLNPNKPCQNCGGDFEKQPSQRDTPISLTLFECCDCEAQTYDWTEEHKKYYPASLQHE